MDFFINAMPVVVYVAASFLAVKTILDIMSAKSKIIGGLRDKVGGATNWARERAQGSKFYQRRDMSKSQRKAERQRSAVEDYARTITSDTARGRRLRRRAGGRDAAGQNRAFVSGIGALDKLEAQEDKDAAALLKYSDIQKPGDLAVVAAGGKIRGVNGSANPALRRAAIRAIIKSQDAGAIESLLVKSSDPTSVASQNPGITIPGVDQQVLVREMLDDYSTSKGAGAHFVTLAPKAGGYTRQEIELAAGRALGALADSKLAAQDGPAWESALAAYKSGLLSPTERARLHDKVKQIAANPQSLSLVKDASMAAYTYILNNP